MGLCESAAVLPVTMDLGSALWSPSKGGLSPRLVPPPPGCAGFCRGGRARSCHPQLFLGFPELMVPGGSHLLHPPLASRFPCPPWSCSLHLVPRLGSTETINQCVNPCQCLCGCCWCSPGGALGVAGGLCAALVEWPQPWGGSRLVPGLLHGGGKWEQGGGITMAPLRL